MDVSGVAEEDEGPEVEGGGAICMKEWGRGSFSPKEYDRQEKNLRSKTSKPCVSDSKLALSASSGSRL